MWGGEPSELLAREGYRITVGAKTLHVVDETFCSVLTNDANCQYLVRLTFGASASGENLKKEKGFDGGVPATSPMPKLVQGWRR